MPVNSKGNRELLAERVVTEADLDDVIEMAINGCISLYERDEAGDTLYSHYLTGAPAPSGTQALSSRGQFEQ